MLEGGTVLGTFPDEFRSSVTICDTVYTCFGDGDVGYVWKTGGGGAPARGCRLDPLLALANVNKCGTSIPDNSNPHCRLPEPCVVSEGEPDLLRCLRNDPTGLPNVLDASWRCVDATSVTPESHEIVEHQNFGPLHTAVLRAKSPAESPRAAPPPAESPPAAPPPAAPPPAESPPVESPSRSSSSFVALRADRPPLGDADLSEQAGWQKCDWFQEKAHLSCQSDVDCHSPEKEFDIWFDSLADKLQGSASASQALALAAEHSTKTDFRWSTTPSSTASTRKELRARLHDLHQTDSQLQTSVRDALRHDRALRAELKEDMRDSCREGRCVHQVVHPSVNLYDGKATLVFQKTDAGLTVARDGGMPRRLNARSCDAPDAPSECRLDYAAHDVDSQNIAPTLSPGAPVVAAFRLHFRDARGNHERFLVSNAVEAHGAIDALQVREDCASRLCERNSHQCPAPHCTLDAQQVCVPNPGRVASVALG